MCATPHDRPVRRAERGGTFSTVLLYIIALFLFMSALLFLAASISLLVDDHKVGSAILGAFICAGTVALGLTIFRRAQSGGHGKGKEAYVPDMHVPHATSPGATGAHLAIPVEGRQPKHQASDNNKDTARPDGSHEERKVVSRTVVAGGDVKKNASYPKARPAKSVPAEVSALASEGPETADTSINQPSGGTASDATGPTQAAAASPNASQDQNQDLIPACAEVAGLVTRSHDVLATLKDFVRHEASTKDKDNRHLASMLEASGLMDWESAPAFEAGRLSRTHHFWLRIEADKLSEKDYDRLISVEAALNVNQELNGSFAQATVEESQPDVARECFTQLTNQQVRRYDFKPVIEAACPGKDVSDLGGEWVVRASIASAAEFAHLPFRASYDQRVNVKEGVCALSLEIPRPRCMAIFSSDEKVRVTLARNYALRLATLLASCAIEHSQLADRSLLSTVYVNCHVQGSTETLLSIRFDEVLVNKLTSILTEGDFLEADVFSDNKDIRASLDGDGWFEPVEPLLVLDDELVSPKWRFDYPELNDAPTSDMLRAITGARKVSDLGINENAVRHAAWDEIAKEGFGSTEQLVSKLKRELYDARDITVSEACNRTIECLLDGNVDAQDEPALRQVFVGGNALDQAVAHSEATLVETDDAEGLERVSALLSEALSPIQSLGVYLDDSDTVYRYFGSVAERIRFNLDIDDHQRQVRLVPDAYYNALSTLSFTYDALNERDKAMECAEELCRIAPASVQAALRKVRILEHQSRTYEASDLIKSMLRLASTPRDAAICHYRLAFLEWKLGREDLAIACYERSLSWMTEITPQAHEELNDLLNSSENLRAFNEDEVIAKLANEGIPLGCDASDLRRTLGAAANCIDEGIFWSAQPLVGLLFSATSDDVLMGVYRSLNHAS